MKDKTTAGVLALLLGGIGIHKFYLGKGLQGALYLFMCWTFIPAFIGFFEGLSYLFMNQAEFDRRYNGAGFIGGHTPQQIAQSVVVNVPGQSRGGDIAEQLARLNELRVAGALTDDEFSVQKARLLT